jgi:hypothetical protein
MKIEDVIKWCDEQSQDGKEVTLCWEGGGDSGWVYMEVDGAQASEPEAEWLVDRMYSILDYGSWAGEFSASGRAPYDSSTKMFEGEDIYSEDQIESIELSNEEIITVKIPKKYFFEDLRIEFENILDGGDVTIRPLVKNGILNQELVTYCESLESELIDKAKELLIKHTDAENSGWQTENWTMQELIDSSSDDPEFYICRISSLEYQGYTEEIRGVSIDLNEYAEQLNDQELEEL